MNEMLQIFVSKVDCMRYKDKKVQIEDPAEIHRLEQKGNISKKQADKAKT